MTKLDDDSFTEPVSARKPGDRYPRDGDPIGAASVDSARVVQMVSGSEGLDLRRRAGWLPTEHADLDA